MSYKATYTTYGDKTTAQISSLTGMQVGDSVFNLDYAEVEWYNGSVWLSNNSVVMTASVTLVEGRCVYINSSGQANLMDGTSTTFPYGIGVVQYGGSAGSSVAVRICGIAKVDSVGGQNINEWARSTNSGKATNSIAPSSGAIGRNLETSSPGLFYSYLSFIERHKKWGF